MNSKQINLMDSAVEEIREMLHKENVPYPKLFIRKATNDVEVLFSIPEPTFLTDKFIDTAYEFVSGIKYKCFEKGLSLNVGFLCDNDSLNIRQLQLDDYELV